MIFFKRIFYFLFTNILVLLTVTIITKMLGLERYLTPAGINYNSLMAYCLIWGFAGAFISLFLSKFMAKMMMGVKIVDERSSYSHVVEMVHRYAKIAGIKNPEVGVYESPDPNAFATGATKNSSLVAVSTGLLQTMNKEEVEGVVAHEVAHIANGDMVTMTLIQGVVNAFVLFFAKIAAFALSKALSGNSDREEQSGGGMNHMVFMVTDIVFQILFGILGSIVVAYFSRLREFRADAGGAKYAGREKMIAGLRKLQRMYEQMPVEEATNFSTMKISSKSNMLKFFATHPPLADRIKALGGQ